MSEDQTLTDTTPGQDPYPFQRPTPTSIDHELTITRQLTVDQILEMAKLPERRARVCLRGDLQAKYDAIVEELSALVTVGPGGEVVADAEASIGEQTNASRAEALGQDLEAVRREMSASMWFPLFRGMPTDDLAVFEKAHLPKDGADPTDYHNRLIAACCVDPDLTLDDVVKLRHRLGFKAFYGLIQTAREVCLGGGVDVPKSLSFSPAQTES